MIIYKYSTQTYKQALDHMHLMPSPYWGQICNFQLLLWLSCILDQSSWIAYLRSRGLLLSGFQKLCKVPKNT